MWTSAFSSNWIRPRLRAVAKIPDICFRQEKNGAKKKKMFKSLDREFGCNWHALSLLLLPSGNKSSFECWKGAKTLTVFLLPSQGSPRCSSCADSTCARQVGWRVLLLLEGRGIKRPAAVPEESQKPAVMPEHGAHSPRWNLKFAPKLGLSHFKFTLDGTVWWLSSK